MIKTHKDGTTPKNGEIFVFGSNLAGIHGAGAAKEAFVSFGAKWGVGHGFTGQTYAIPTKDVRIKTLPIACVESAINVFNMVAKASGEEFWVTRVGCGLAGFTDEEIAPLFIALPNVNFPEEWENLITK